MKITHICLTSPFSDGMSYQENELVAQHVALGQDVSVVASTESFGAGKRIIHAKAGATRLACGAPVYRLAHAQGLPIWLSAKIRAHRGLDKLLAAIKPDRIMFHGMAAWDLKVVAAYVRRNPSVKLIVDCHMDFNNSAQNWCSRELLHRRFYKLIFLQCIDQIEQVLCVTVESLDFALNFYDSPAYKTRIYPLGCVTESVDQVNRRRAHFRSIHCLTDADVAIVQTGKLDSSKGLASALRAFSSNTSPRLRFFIAGYMHDEVKEQCSQLIKSDNRVVDLGWQDSDQLRTVLAGSDCFLQPFGQTVSTQMAMGYGCVILVEDVPSHRWLVDGNGYLFQGSEKLPEVFDWVVKHQLELSRMKEKAVKFARSKLDYRNLALEIIN